MVPDRWVQPKTWTPVTAAKLGTQNPLLHPSHELRWASHYNAQWVRRARALPELLKGAVITVFEAVVGGQQIVNAWVCHHLYNYSAMLMQVEFEVDNACDGSIPVKPMPTDTFPLLCMSHDVFRSWYRVTNAYADTSSW